jgi:hypothetical protein
METSRKKRRKERSTKKEMKYVSIKEEGKETRRHQR